MKTIVFFLALSPTFCMKAQINEDIIWKGIFLETVERTHLYGTDTLMAESFITGKAGGERIQVWYRLKLTRDWQFLSAEFTSAGYEPFTLSRNDNSQWLKNGVSAPELKGCEYVDINLTPFTNSLPINHLSMRVTESREIKVAFIDLLKMDIQPAMQRYTKVGSNQYRYENLESDFVRIIETDETGLVVEYPGIWTRVYTRSNFADVLQSANASPDLGNAAQMYDWLVGSWTVKAVDYLSADKTIEQFGEWHFSWVLEGRALQDVWIAPKRELRYPGMDKTANRYGTTLRTYNQHTQSWNITWINPVTGAFDRLVGKQEDGRLVHEGKNETGDLMKWIFSDITDTSFRWFGEISKDNGKTWELQAEFFATKTM